MKVTIERNIELKNDVFVCPEKEGICISEFYFTFDQDVEILDKDHCECIHSIIQAYGPTLNIRLITEKTPIDEFIIIKTNIQNLKIRFKR